MSHLEAALQQAQLAVRVDEVPIGAVIVKDGIVISAAHNLTETRNDPTAHAEMLAIRAACESLGQKYLSECDLYVTLEPCAMCAQAISLAKIRRVYFGAYDPKGGGVEHGARVFSQTTCHHKPEVYGGMMENECGELLKRFFEERRF
ncbi:MAG: nucleoside deaminase [Rickettsiales bacterium]